nr:MAG TPA: hypothetical protein [Bacteriophage sp.]
MYVLDSETNTYRLVSSVNIGSNTDEFLNSVLSRLENINRGSEVVNSENRGSPSGV